MVCVRSRIHQVRHMAWIALTSNIAFLGVFVHCAVCSYPSFPKLRELCRTYYEWLCPVSTLTFMFKLSQHFTTFTLFQPGHPCLPQAEFLIPFEQHLGFVSTMYHGHRGPTKRYDGIRLFAIISFGWCWVVCYHHVPPTPRGMVQI